MLKKTILPLLSGCMLLLLFGCSTYKSPQSLPDEFSSESSESDPGSLQLTELAYGDMIELSVEVDGKMEVAMHRAVINSSGHVTLPLVGDVKVAGLYLDGARSLIQKTYGAYFVNSPVVMLGMVDEPGDVEWGFVTMTGRLEMPGRVRIPSSNGIKLTAAIQEAGGFAPSAKKTEVRVSRMDKNGRKITVTVNYQEIGQKGNADADIDLTDGDIVYVPERFF